MVTLETRLSENLKTQTDALFNDMRLTTDALRMFLTQCINHGSSPFQPKGKRPNNETLNALNEKNGSSYKSVEELSELWK